MTSRFDNKGFARTFGVPVRRAATLLMVLGAAALASLPAVAGTLTLAWTGGSWNDGGALSGTFTVDYNDSTGAPTSLVSADVITGNGTNGDGFPGQTYLYNVPGDTNTVSEDFFDATQAAGAPANELVLYDDDGFVIFLDWQGTSPTGLWVGNADGQYSSEEGPGVARSLNNAGGSAGTPDDSTPEPSTLFLTGVALVGVGWLSRVGWLSKGGFLD
jgi:hypothetical protein